MYIFMCNFLSQFGKKFLGGIGGIEWLTNIRGFTTETFIFAIFQCFSIL